MRKTVHWQVDCQTLVDADSDEEARQLVMDMFDDRPWGKTDGCRMTFERMEVLTVTDAE